MGQYNNLQEKKQKKKSESDIFSQSDFMELEFK